MQPYDKNHILKGYLDWLTPYVQQRAQNHIRFLELRQQGLRQMAEILARQANPGRPTPVERFTLADLREFAEGDVVKCLGQRYAVYNGRRSPRIPNRDLLLMTRIMDIDGKPDQFDRKTSIVSEYDVPRDAWYLSGMENGRLPLSICLEIALQPCGFLSAYLGTPLRFPEEDFSFRNLDGQAQFVNQMDVRGKTIQTRAELSETIFSGRTIIQHFSFAVLCGGQVLFKGNSSFGYFPSETMLNQIGLDGGKTSQPWFKGALPDASARAVSAGEAGLPEGQLRLIERVVTNPGGGRNQAGYVYANRPNSPSDWYYACHFYQDPVMPGSLGIEAIVQAIKVFAFSQEKSPSFVSIASGREFTWKYRGQVLQNNRQMQLEVHLQKSRSDGGNRYLSGDASLWADDLRIYEIKNLTLAIQE